MDISIITASIGSFVLSERVIKVSQLVGQSCSRSAEHIIRYPTLLFARFDFMLTSFSKYMCCFASHPSPPTTRTTPSLSNPYAVSGLACRSVFFFSFDRRSMHLYRNPPRPRHGYWPCWELWWRMISPRPVKIPGVFACIEVSYGLANMRESCLAIR